MANVPQSLVDFTAKAENFTPTSYPDGSQWSIGYGTKASGPGQTITQAAAQQALVSELGQAADYVDSIPGASALNDNQRAALIDQAYNAGGFGPTLTSAIASGNPAAITSAMSLYTGTSAPGTEQGVANRRAADISLFNGTSPASGQAATVQQASFTPPNPNLSPNDAGTNSNWSDVSPVSYGGLLGSSAPQQGLLSASTPASALYGFGQSPTPVNYVPAPPTAPSGQPVAPPAQAAQGPTTQASSWLPPSLLPGGSGFVDDLTDDPNYQRTPLSSANYLGSSNASGGFSPAEATTIPPGPYGADSIISAAESGDPKTLQAAENTVMQAAIAQNGILGLGKAQAALTSYFNQVQQQAPGAVRAAQTALFNNPALAQAIPSQLKPMVADAFAALPPPPTALVPLPNLAPPYTGPATPPPLVASNPANPLQPKMASLNSATQPQPPLFSSSPLSIWDPTYGTGTQQPTATDQQKAAATASLAAGLQQQQSGDGSSSYQSSPGQTSSFDPAALNLPSSILSDPTTAMLFNAQSGNTFGSSFGSSNDLPGRTAIQPSSGSSIPGNSLLGYGSPLPSSAFTAGLTQPVANPFGQSSSYLFGGIPTGAGIGFGAPPPIVPTLPRQATVAAAAPARPAPIIPMPNIAPTPGVNAGYPTLPGATQGTYSGTQGSNTYTFDPTSGQGVYYDPSSGQQFDYSSTDQSNGGNWSNSIGNGF